MGWRRFSRKIGDLWMGGIGLKITSLCALLTLALAGAALVHVEVAPSEVPAGSPEELTVSALGEKEIPVVEVRMEFPDGFRVTGVPRWTGGRAGRGKIPPGRPRPSCGLGVRSGRVG